MAKATDIRPIGAALYFLPVKTRLPLKFGPETLTSVTCARVCLKVADAQGRTACGWGETPLSVQWVWPSALPYAERHDALQAFCLALCKAWATFDARGHPLEVGHAFQESVLPGLLAEANRQRVGREPMPWLAALVCTSPFDLALHDAYGILHGRPTYDLYGLEWTNRDLSAYLTPEDASIRFEGRSVRDYLVFPRPDWLPAWHL
ncbi:MAG: hypothetical protein H5T66_14985, partial [Chloroflexi bacterium]|nr:hypothetical protein [Chloroflexota bacterium]